MTLPLIRSLLVEGRILCVYCLSAKTGSPLPEVESVLATLRESMVIASRWRCSICGGRDAFGLEPPPSR